MRTSLVLTGLLCAMAGPATAQRVSLAPTVGIYAPTADLVNAVVAGQQVTLRQQVGLSVGGRLGILFSERFGFVATGQYVPSDLQAELTEDGLSQDFEGKSDLWFGSGRLSFWLLPVTSPVFVGVNGGVGVAGRGETTINGVTSGSRTDVGGVLGATVGFRLGGFALTLTLDDYIYKPEVFEELGVKPKTQNDLHFSVGFGVPLGR